MKCPACQSEKNRVIDTRSWDTCNRRIRECCVCFKTWVTWELNEKAIMIVDSEPLIPGYFPAPKQQNP